MFILEKYLLLFIMSCFPLVPIQDGESQEEYQFLHKDSVTEISEPNNILEKEDIEQAMETLNRVEFDTTTIDNREWKIRKQIILGN